MQEVNSKEVWDEEWSKLTVESEIKMWDFYGLRQWILKYAPRHGDVLEAGCGLGRYVLYLNKLNINCIGLELSHTAIAKIQKFERENNLMQKFCRGDVKSLPFKDESLSGYISLGVIEHFLEGPQKVLEEAFRVLRSGGIAIISTPSISFSQVLLQTKTKMKRAFKNCVKKIIRYPIYKSDFFQYWYTPKKLKCYLQNAGFKVSIVKGADLLYSFYELGYVPKSENWFNRTISKLENTFIANIGAQAITISYKAASKMYCFLCGNFNVTEDEMETIIPICNGCLNKSYAKYYMKSNRPRLKYTYIVNPVFELYNRAKCEYCGEEYKFHRNFENYGFAKNVCITCLKSPLINIELSNNYVQLIWRLRGKL